MHFHFASISFSNYLYQRRKRIKAIEISRCCIDRSSCVRFQSECKRLKNVEELHISHAISILYGFSHFLNLCFGPMFHVMRSTLDYYASAVCCVCRIATKTHFGKLFVVIFSFSFCKTNDLSISWYMKDPLRFVHLSEAHVMYMFGLDSTSQGR